MMTRYGNYLTRAIGKVGKTRLVLFCGGLLFVLVLVINGAADTPGHAADTPNAPNTPNGTADKKGGKGGAGGPVRVDSAPATRSDVPVHIDGLGSVQAFYTVTVTPRVDGQLLSLGFVEGQTVRQGDLLAKIDPRPYQAAVDQAVAVKSKDAAQLVNARRDLERYVTLAPQDFTSKQTLETQRALVAQLEAQVAGDQAVIDNAKTQLDYATIRSPIQGRTGIRLTDPGNIVHAANSTGIVVVTQVQPISVIFTLPADSLDAVRRAMAAGSLPVSALSRDNTTTLDSGTVALIDNQIDPTTGTMRLKATFPNKDNSLWPGQFVNARVRLAVKQQALTIPSAAVQRGPKGFFAYVVKPDNTVEMRDLDIGDDNGTVAVINKGLQEGERVTTSNQYRLKAGVHVQLAAAGTSSTGKPAGKAANKGPESQPQ